MINGLKFFVLYLSMLGNVFSRPENSKIYLKRIIDEMIKIGVNSLTIVSIISLFMGAVVTIQTGLQLHNPFIPKYLIGYATRESLILEFSPTMIALILAGKVGSSIASEIGTMRVSEQIDALEIMGLNWSAKWEEIQKKFKLLVKKYHPDKNQGSKKYEDKLKIITLAYSQLKMTLGKK